MKLAFRWFGSEDFNIKYIRHIPKTKQVVWALHEKQPGEVWELDEIQSYVNYIKENNLEYDVVESVNVHDDIKLGKDTRDEYIQNYITTIKNLSSVGVKVICYNFMPVFDWTRTNLEYELEDGSNAMHFDYNVLKNIDPLSFKDQFLNMSSSFKLPGWEPERLAQLEILFGEYSQITHDDLWNNLKYFLDAIMPTCEEFGIKMAIHPDDPGFEIFGLDRMIASKEDIERLLKINNSTCNGLTFCTGSLGTNKDNNLVELLEDYIEKIYFIHLRNIKFSDEKNFTEVSHVTSDGDVDIKKIIEVIVEKKYSSYLRPDHGRNIFGEAGKPGYGLYDRALGIMYINGLYDMKKGEK